MWTVVSVCLVTVFTILGITELLREFWVWLLRPKGSPPAFFTITLYDDIFLEQIRFAEEYVSWEGKKNFGAIVLISCNLSDENIKILKNKSLNNKSIYIINSLPFDKKPKGI